MEYIPSENSEADEKAREVSQYCLGLPTIVRQILQQFSTNELIKLSRVNKLWNYEARTVMKERGNLRANSAIGGADNQDPCQKLAAFASDLSHMRVVPFYGIRIDMSDGCDCQLICNESLERAYKEILDRIPWKHFSVRFLGGYENSMNCPALALVKKILEDNCGVLEELTLGHVREEFYQNIFQGRSWPCLRTLKLKPGDPRCVDDPLTSPFIKTLVSYVPNLKELHVDRPIDLTVNVMEGSSAKLVPDYRFRPLFEPICEDLIRSIGAKFMEMRIQTDEIDPGLLHTFIPTLLQASRSTLKSLFMDLLFAVPLMCYGICLDNVTKLDIIMNGYTLDVCAEPAILALAKGLDFTRTFPKLQEVTIMDDFDRGFSSDVVGEFVEQGNEMLSRALPDRAAGIKLLKFDDFGSMQESTLPLLAQMFPDVKTVQKKGTPRCSFANLREHFLSLEEVIQIPHQMCP